jgi:hypothetical protein
MGLEVVKCDRWAECQKRDEEMKHMLERIDDRKEQEHREMWSAINETNRAVNDLAVTVGSLVGKFVGLMMAGSLVVGIITFIASKVIH